MVGQLICHAYAMGYELTFGEAWRPLDPRNHGKRLAIDFNLFSSGKWLQSTEAHRPLGEYWESLGGAWGGRFDDGNHYSLEHKGVK